MALSALTEPGDHILCENPTHNTAAKIMKLHGLEIVGVDMEDDGIDLDKLQEALSNNLVSMGFLIPSYHNPTGIVMSPEKRVEVLNTFARHRVPHRGRF